MVARPAPYIVFLLCIGRKSMTEQHFSADQIAAACAALDGQSPQAILQWAVETFSPNLTMATAFGPEGNCIIHMLADIRQQTGQSVRIFNLDTGYQFPETLELRERLRDRYGIEVEYVRADLSVPEYEAKNAGPVSVLEPERCCHDRKLVPLRRAVAGYAAWVSAIRKDQTKDRAQASVVQWDPKFSLVKVNPLLHWTKNDVWKFIDKNDVPYNPLHDRNYPSIGCWPCTRPVGAGEDERAGRWSGTAKKECGLHVVEQEGGSGI